MSPPTLGVVIPVLDEERRLPRLLERLLGAGREPADRADEVVVTDGGSTDGTEALAREHRCGWVTGSPGRGAQLARGARHTSADVLLFLHADCLPEEGALARVRAAYAGGDVAFSALRQRIDGERLLYRCIERCADARARLGVVYGDSGLGVRRDVYEEVGGFRDLPVFEDVDLSRRLRRVARVAWLRDAGLRVSPRRWEGEGVLRCTLRNWMLLAGYLAGRDPSRLARRYPPPEPGS